MKSLLMGTTVLLTTLAATPLLAQTLTLYSAQGFAGEARRYTGPESNLNTQRFNDRAYSLVAQGKWQVCLDADYRSACRVYEGRIPDLGDMGGKISSVRPVPLDAYVPGRPGRSTATLYSDFRYSGPEVRVEFEAPNLGELGFNDRASSMRVPPGSTWELCEDVFFRGRCEVVTGDVYDFGDIQLNDRVSSIRQVEAGYRPGGGRPGGGYPGGGYPGGGWGDDGWDNWQGSGGRPAATGRTAAFFASPQWNGRPIPACWGRGSYGAGSECAERTADQFCQRQGYRTSAYFSVSPGGRQSVLEDVLCRR